MCGADGTLKVARAALHFWEEPPISGESGSGTVFFSNCPLQCIYCQNAVIARGKVGLPITVERLAQIFRELQAQGALNINLVTATHYTPQVLDALAMARGDGMTLPVVWNTSGYEVPETIHLIEDAVDVFLTDLRYMSSELAKRFSHASNYPEVARTAIKEMAKTDADIIVRILVLPGHTDEAKASVAWLWSTFGTRVKLSLMSQFTPVQPITGYPELNRRLTPEEFEDVLDFADSLGCDDYFWQEGDAAEESFIPDFEACEGVLRPPASLRI
jgi:putative pyruvate formate lyase activating enzyme